MRFEGFWFDLTRELISVIATLKRMNANHFVIAFTAVLPRAKILK